MERSDLDQLVVWMDGISFREASPDWRISRSVVPLHVLALFTRGGGTWEIDGKEYAPRSGDILYVHKSAIREARTDAIAPPHFFALRLLIARAGTTGDTPSLELSDYPGPLPLPTLHRSRRYSQILGLMQRLHDEGTQWRPGRRLYGHSMAMQVVLQACEGAAPANAPKASRQVEKAVEYIHTHYPEPIAVQDLAGETNLSARQLRTVFQAVTGLSPIAYLHQHRLERAKAMLLSGRVTVQEVSQAVGYPDQAYFARVFKRATGVTPSAFARSQQVE